MTRLIDADRLLTDRMKSKYYHLPNGDTAIPIIDIEHAPTIDAVEVVRCKDCKHQEHCHETVSHTKFHDGFKEHWSEPIEWCSRGERKGGEDE